MPELLSESAVKLEFADLYRRRPIERPDARPRHKGFHQSGVLGYIARQVGWLKTGERLEDEMPTSMALGVMFEEFWFSCEPLSVIWQPGEVVVDEIACNCDGVDTDKQRIVETKCTSKKVRVGDEFLAERMWMYQGMAYLWAYRELYDVSSNVVRWVICYYKGGEGQYWPVIKEHVVKFSESEIEGAWRLLLKFRDRAPRED